VTPNHSSLFGRPSHRSRDFKTRTLPRLGQRQDVRRTRPRLGILYTWLTVWALLKAKNYFPLWQILSQNASIVHHNLAECKIEPEHWWALMEYALDNPVPLTHPEDPAFKDLLREGFMAGYEHRLSDCEWQLGMQCIEGKDGGEGYHNPHP